VTLFYTLYISQPREFVRS